jgi:hypothetical protein
MKIEPELSVFLIGPLLKDPDAIDANRASMLVLACHLAGLTTHAQFGIE